MENLKDIPWMMWVCSLTQLNPYIALQWAMFNLFVSLLHGACSILKTTVLFSSEQE